ncbi:LOG family protein [Anthocerotibacter panamensis]
MDVIQRVCVYCASSTKCDPIYRHAATRLGQELARHEVVVVYGGGGVGLMGCLADGALSVGGTVIGILPNFMQELEWGHNGLTDLQLVADMHTRKRLMIEGVDAVIALPGGCGTLEELFEAITWKRLGLYLNPIVLVNTQGFFDPCLELLERCVSEHFMDDRHRAMWTVVDEPEAVIAAIQQAPPWDSAAWKFAEV